MIADQTIEIDTPGGGQVVVAFADPTAHGGAAAIQAALAITRIDGPQGELEGVIIAEALRRGLEAVVWGARHPTTILVESRRLEGGPPSPAV